MEANLGGGIALAVAAGLWLLYLVPSWLRRNEYLHTERNAVRLQQSLRVMAETAAMPEELSVELSGRGVSQQRRAASRAAAEQAALARAADHAASPASPSRAARVDEEAPAPYSAAQHLAVQPASSRASLAGGGPLPGFVVGAGQRSGVSPAAVRLRRSRLATTVLLAVALVVLVLSLAPVFAGAQIAWGALLCSAAVVAAATSMLTVMARVSRRRRSSYREAMRRPAQAFIDYAPAAAVRAAPQGEDRAWTPTPLPKPLYAEQARAEQLHRAQQQAQTLRTELARRAADTGYGYATADAAAPVPAPRSAATVAQQLQRESEQSTERLRAADRAVPGVGAAAAAKAPETRYARMGVIEEPPSSGLADLDAVFRRRAVG